MFRFEISRNFNGYVLIGLGFVGVVAGPLLHNDKLTEVGLSLVGAGLLSLQAKKSESSS